MRPAAMMLALALSWSSLVAPLLRPTNSRAAVEEGIRAFSRGRFRDAAEAFSQAAGIKPSPITSYDLGTAEIAAGKRKEGAETLGAAMRDPALRASSLYNRGNAALESRELPQAIADYTAALRITPGDRDAKRNLEIALRRKEVEDRQKRQGAGKGGQSPKQGREQRSPQPQAGPRQEKDRGNADVEALLRSIEQQEREELQRMRRGKGEQKRVGW